MSDYNRNDASRGHQNQPRPEFKKPRNPNQDLKKYLVTLSDGTQIIIEEPTMKKMRMASDISSDKAGRINQTSFMSEIIQMCLVSITSNDGQEIDFSGGLENILPVKLFLELVDACEDGEIMTPKKKAATVSLI